jgi:hypothetical protein
MSFEDYWHYDNLEVKIRIEYGIGIPSWFLSCLVNAVESSLVDIVHEQVDLIYKELPAEMQSHKEVTHSNVNKKLGNALLIKDFEKGSLEIEAVLTGLAVFVISTTIGEPFKVAWTKNKLHKKLVDKFDALFNSQLFAPKLKNKIRQEPKLTSLFDEQKIDVSQDPFDGNLTELNADITDINLVYPYSTNEVVYGEKEDEQSMDTHALISKEIDGNYRISISDEFGTKEIKLSPEEFAKVVTGELAKGI